MTENDLSLSSLTNCLICGGSIDPLTKHCNSCKRSLTEMANDLPNLSTALQKEIVTLPTGATRSGTPPRYDLICPMAIRAIAEAMTEGAKKHGTCNWTKGMSNSTLINHTIEHLLSYLAGDLSEDHIGHALANLGMFIHFEKGCKCHESFERDSF
jgi:hypothetical protein